MSLTFTQLQRESKAWVARNFGNRPLHQPVLGLAEEYGELIAADKLVDIQDAVADIVIFLADFCNSCNIDMEHLRINSETFAYTVTMSRLERYMAVEIGKLCHHYLKREQGIRGTADFHTNEIANHVQHLLAILKIYSKLCGFDFMTNLEQVWHKVSQRDWTRQRAIAGVISPPGALPTTMATNNDVHKLDNYAAYKISR